MSTDVLESLRYPIGKLDKSTADPAHRAASIATIRALPANLRNAIKNLNDEQLNTPYRDGGWSVLQTIHHIADSHLNAYSRFRHALAEEWPTIYAYNESAWAKYVDARTAPVELSLEMIEGMHGRWSLLLDSLADSDFSRGYLHPENGRQTLEQVLALYAWHSRHHTAHIIELLKRKGW